MFCGKCGKQIRDNSKFCEFCGAPVMPVPTKAKTGQASVTPAGEGEAPYPLPVSAPTPPPAAGTPLAVTPARASAGKKKKTKAVVLVCAVGAAAVLAAGGMWWKMREAENASGSLYARSETAENQQDNALMEENMEETAEVDLEEAETFSGSEAAQGEPEAVEESDLAEYGDAEEIETLEREAGTEVPDLEAESESDWDSAGEYILPECDTRLYTIEELAALSPEELRLARNELYARHGRIFQTEDLSDYFSEKTWYTPRYTAEEMNAMGDSFLNAYEKENRNRILQAESAQKGERPMQVVNCQESITLRNAPSVTAAELCQIPLGAVVVYKGAAEGTFYQVEYEGVIGYAIGTYFAEL